MLLLLPSDPGNLLIYTGHLVAFAIAVLVQFRFGLVASAFAVFSIYLFSSFPLTLDVSVWYAGYGYVALTIFALVLYAFRTSLGGRPMYAASHLDD